MLRSVALVFTFLGIVAATLCPGPRQAICYMRPDKSSTQNVTGLVMFSQDHDRRPLRISVRLQGFVTPPGQYRSHHGFHVHEYGDLSGGCGSTGGHYNPDGVTHGARRDAVRHAGDFGNLKQANGQMVVNFKDRKASLFGSKSIIGRAIVVHAGRDDLGRGGDASSLANGNAGSRLACCVIGFRNPPSATP